MGTGGLRSGEREERVPEVVGGRRCRADEGVNSPPSPPPPRDHRPLAQNVSSSGWSSHLSSTSSASRTSRIARSRTSSWLNPLSCVSSAS